MRLCWVVVNEPLPYYAAHSACRANNGGSLVKYKVRVCSSFHTTMRARVLQQNASVAVG